MRKDIMVDIETLGTKEGASIFQIAAVSFDIRTGTQYDKINLIGDIAEYDSLSVDGTTLKWWLDTDAKLLAELLNAGTLSERDMLGQFSEWLLDQGEETYLWGNGILFDNAKIKHAFETNGIRYPIRYNRDRDFRTLLEMASLKSGVGEYELKDSVILDSESMHDAYDDCKRQIRLAHKCYTILNEGGR